MGRVGSPAECTRAHVGSRHAVVVVDVAAELLDHGHHHDGVHLSQVRPEAEPAGGWMGLSWGWIGGGLIGWIDRMD